LINKNCETREFLWVPETARTTRDLPVRLRQVARHDPLMALRLIYQMFTKLLGSMVLRTRSDTTKDIEILVLRHELAVWGSRSRSSPRPARIEDPAARDDRQPCRSVSST
jgi:hypothetical protein